MRGSFTTPFVPVKNAPRKPRLTIVGLALVLLAFLAAHTAAARLTASRAAQGGIVALETPIAGPSFAGGPVSRLLKAATDVDGTIAPGGAPVTVTLASGEVARLTFTGTTGQRIFTKFTGNTIGSGCYQTLNVSILDAGGATVASKSWVCQGSDYLETFPLPSKSEIG